MRSGSRSTPEFIGIAEALARLRALLRGKKLSAHDLHILRTHELIAGPHGRAAVLTAKGRALLRRSERAAMPTDCNGCSHPTETDPTGKVHDRDNVAELLQGLPSPLHRLACPRKGEAPMLGPAALLAARRFQHDLERAGLRQRITQSWSLAALIHQGEKARGDGGRHEPSAMLDARDQVNRACRSIGPDFSGLLIDVCLMEKNLACIERERQWPARSAKLAIALGLNALARHYGLSDHATGRSAPICS